MKNRLLIIAALMVLSSAVQARNMSNQELTQRIDEVFSAVYNNPAEPGAAVLIMQGNDTLYSRCFGVADRVTKAPVTFATNFCIASVSKQFSAVALLQLAEEGKLSLNDPLSKFFPEFQAPFFSENLKMPKRTIFCPFSTLKSFFMPNVNCYLALRLSSSAILASMTSAGCTPTIV